MTANGAAAYGIYPRNVALPEVVCALNRAGFGNEDICMVLSPAHPDAELVRAPSIFHRKANDGATTAQMIGWFSKMGAVVIPTVGFFVRSNMYLQALAAEPGTATLSRGSGVLVGLGFSPDDAQRLGNQLSDFGALVYVSCPEKAKAAGVIELLRDAGAREAASLGASQANAAHAS